MGVIGLWATTTMITYFLVLALFSCCCAYSAVRYDDYRVYRVLPKNLQQVNVLRDLDKQYFTFWTKPSHPNHNVDIMVEPNQIRNFEKTLKFLGLEENIMIENVQNLINISIARSSTFNWENYQSLDRDRLWRKTRKPYEGCMGSDPNRNWDYHWMEGGASLDLCSYSYAGPFASSEVETTSLSKFISTIATELDGHIAFHSYGQKILIPFGHEGLEVLSNNEELVWCSYLTLKLGIKFFQHQIGNLAAEKLAERNGTKYSVGNNPNIMCKTCVSYKLLNKDGEVLDIASGVSTDWVAGVKKVKMVYTFELPDEGRYGFLLPADQIIPTGQETFDAVMVMIDELNRHF
ncbi:hypothetical protein FQR65_LT01941 [Abscondita terminalis]|nr:hypothetical protein FQR65_LT01941 [Abscondita terminalis]